MPLTWKYMSSARKRSMKVATPTEEKAARKPNKDKRKYSDSEKEKNIFFSPLESRYYAVSYSGIPLRRPPPSPRRTPRPPPPWAARRAPAPATPG